MPSHTDQIVRDISVRAQQARIHVLNMVFRAQTGHIGGAFSAAEIIASLYFHHLSVDPTAPAWPQRDRFILSKGHACAVLYAVLAERGFFPVRELSTFRQLDSRLQGHPDRLKLPGIELSAGPLGHGIAVGAGMALALRSGSGKPSAISAPSARSSAGKVYVLVGDGEINAGLIWEAALVAAKFRLGNLTVLLDYNGIQQTGATADVLPTEDIEAKWKAFGWHAQEINGHDVRQVLDALDLSDEVHARPSMIVCRTTKGKGVSFMEYDNRWHGAPPNKEQYEQALSELQQGLAACRI